MIGICRVLLSNILSIISTAVMGGGLVVSVLVLFLLRWSQIEARCIVQFDTYVNSYLR